METMIYLDTHVLVWLYAYGRHGLPEGVANRLESTSDLLISPMVRLELEYLYEIGRVTQPAAEVVDRLSPALALSVCQTPFPVVAREAERHQWTRDPFDRVVVAQAAILDATLITKDRTIRQNYQHAEWPSD